MVKYKWVALSNTTIGVLMATINMTITLISLPAIFNGIDLNPLDPGSFVYLLWILMGFNIVTATLLVTFGRLSDIFGRVRLFNLGFAVFTVGSVLLFFTPGKGSTAALLLVIFRIVQGVGAAFLFSNSSAILTDAFPSQERGKALGINQVAALGGSFLGLILGGILSVFNWRYIFLVSVPVGLIGTVWSYWKLKETSVRKKDQKIDYIGNITFGGGLTIALIAVTYGLMPYNGNTTGWSSPFVIAGLVVGVLLLAIFPIIEMKVEQPMFRMSLFKIRAFAAGNIASLLSAVGRGGVMLMLIILLQGIWLPLHGYSYASTPFWAGVYMIPMTIGFMVMGPLSGWLSDKHGARVLSTAGMVIVAASFFILTLLGPNFSYWIFGLTLFIMGVGNGMFAAPNTAAIMNSVPADSRGAASGMMTTLRNAGMTASLGIFFTIVLVSLNHNLPIAFNNELSTLGLSSLDKLFDSTPPTVAMFSAFLGINPVHSILSVQPGVIALIPPSTLTMIEGLKWFPQTLAPAFMGSLRDAFYVGLILSLAAAVISVLRGKRFVDSEAEYVAQMDGEEPKYDSRNEGTYISASGQDKKPAMRHDEGEYETSGGVK